MAKKEELNREDMLERYRALGYTEERAKKMADAAMLGTEARFGQRNIEQLTGAKGVNTGGRYGTYVGPGAGASLAQGFMGGKAMMDQPKIFERGKGAGLAGIESLAAGMGMGGGADTQAKVNALRNYAPGMDGPDPAQMQPVMPAAPPAPPPQGPAAPAAPQGSTSIPPRPSRPGDANLPAPQPFGARMQQNMPPGVNYDVNDPQQMAELERTNPVLAAKMREFKARGG